MVDRKDEPADARMRDVFGRDRASKLGLGELGASTAGFEAFKKSIAHQLAARTARLAEESSSLGASSGSDAPDTIGKHLKKRQDNLEKSAFSSPLFILGLGFALGVSAGAGAMYYFQSWSSPPPLRVLAEPKLPLPSATVAASQQTAIAPTPVPAPVVVDPMATLHPSSTREAPSQQPAPVKADPITSPQSPPGAVAVGATIAPKSSVLPPDQTKLSRPEILEVQTRLESLGMKPGPLDGFFGPLLAAATRRYEEAKRRPQIGNVDRELLERLRQETNEPSPQVPPQR